MNKKLLFKICFSCILIVVLFMSIDLYELAKAVRSVNFVLLFCSYALSIPGILIKTFKWQLLLHTHDITSVRFVHLWSLYHIGMFFSNFLPSEVGGDFIRSYFVGKTAGKQPESLAAVIMERMTGLIAIVIYGILGIFLNWSFASQLGLTTVGFTGFGCAVIFIALFFNKSFARIVKKIIEIGPVKKVITTIKSFYSAMHAYIKKGGILFMAMFLSLIFQLLVIVGIKLLLFSLGIEIKFALLMLIVPMITLVGMIPIAINSIGLREGAFVFLFSQVAVSTADAFAIALLYRVGTLLPSIAGGVLYAVSGKKIKELKGTCKDADIEESNSESQK